MFQEHESANQSEPTQQRPPKWLRHIQENSWEAEIIISGGAVFSLIQLSDFLAVEKISFSENAPFTGLDPLTIFSMLAVKGITLGFILHLITRGLWIALVCLNGAFPEGIQRNKIPLAAKYSNPNESPSLERQIVLLDKVSGVIYSSGFVFVLIVLGLIITMFLILFLGRFLPWLALPLLALLLIYYVDFFLAGPLRRKQNWIAKIYYPIYWAFEKLTLAFLYRKPVQLVISNTGRISAFIFVFVFLVATFGLSYFSLRGVLHLPDPFQTRLGTGTTKNAGIIYTESFYMDQMNDEANIRWYAIDSDVIEKKYLKIFVNFRASYEPAKSNDGVFEKVVAITIDGVTIENIDWLNSKRLKANQEGILAMIPVIHLSEGKHILALKIDDPYYKQFPVFPIPFWTTGH